MSYHFNVTPGEMLEGSRAVRIIFIQDQQDFKDFDLEFDTPFAGEWETSILASEAAETAETRLDEQKAETAVVLEDMKQVRFIFAQSKYFVQKAFPKQAEVQNKFGLNNVDKDGSTQKELAIFLTTLYTQCNSAANKPALLAAGMTQLKIDAIASLAAKFVGDNQTQNAFILQTAQATEDRAKQYNATYDYWQRVNRASKVVFWDNLIKLNQYAMPHGSEGENFNVEGKVTDGSNNNANLKNVDVEIKELGIVTKTNFYGNFGFVNIPAGSYTLSFTLPGYGPKTVPFTLVQDGKAVVNTTMQVL